MDTSNMTRLALIRRSTRPPRKDVDVPRRAVIAYLSSMGMSQEEIADYFNITQSRVSVIVSQSTYPCPPEYNWRAH